MKLWTEMQDGCVHATGYCVDEDAVELRQAEMLVHDAAAAHALMQAMREAGDGSADVSFYSDDDYQNWVYARVDSLMRSWGFDSGEDA